MKILKIIVISLQFFEILILIYQTVFKRTSLKIVFFFFNNDLSLCTVMANNRYWVSPQHVNEFEKVFEK